MSEYPLKVTIQGPDLEAPDFHPSYLYRLLVQEKNWRLGGALVYAPDGDAERFQDLRENDVCIMAFSGADIPQAAKIVLVPRDDKKLVAAIRAAIGTNTRLSMKALTTQELEQLLDQAGVDQEHPAHALTKDDYDIEALPPEVVTPKTFVPYRERRLRRYTKEEMQALRQRQQEIGDAGEDWFRLRLEEWKATGIITEYEWVARDDDAAAPYDYILHFPDGSECLLDNKTTTGPFDSDVYLSYGEMLEAVHGGLPFRIARTYDLEGTPRFRLTEDLRDFLKPILDHINGLAKVQPGIRPTSFKLSADILPWDDDFPPGAE